MSTVFHLIHELSFVFLDFFAFYRLLSNKLTFKFSSKLKPLIHACCYILLLVCNYSSEIYPTLPIKFIFLILFGATLVFIYKDSFLKKIFWIICTYFLMFICELVVIPLMVLITNISMDNIISNPALQSIGTLSARLLLFIIVEILIHSKKQIDHAFTNEYSLIVYADVIFALIFTNFFYYDYFYLSAETAIMLCLATAFIVSLLAVYLLRKITKKSEEIMITNLKLQQIEMENAQNKNMEIVLENLRSLRHDMNNHVSVLQGLLSLEEYEEAKNYLSSICEELSIANNFIFTENKVLSILLNNKISRAKQLGIDIETELLTSTTPFSDSDLCTVIGNIIENAIEAAVTHEKPYIFFSMRNEQQNLIIQCDNSFTTQPIFKNGALVTTKSNKSYHGIGTKNITSITKSYHGTVLFTVDELFHVNISVPL